MNRLEQGGSESTPENIGEFAIKSGRSPRELAAGEQSRREKETRGVSALLGQLQEKGCDQLASYLSGLSQKQITKIDVGLDGKGKGIVSLFWAEPEQQDEIQEALSEIVQAQDDKGVSNASERVVRLLE